MANSGRSTAACGNRLIGSVVRHDQTSGTARGDDLARLLEDRQCGDFLSLTKLLVADKVFGFEWRETIWISMFQFDLRGLSVILDNQEDRSPVDLVNSNLSAVLEAARADRLITTG